MGEHAHKSVQLSHLPNITSLKFFTYLVVIPLICHMNFVPQPPFLYSNDPLDDTILCSSILDSILIMNEDQAIHGVGFAQPTCIVIHEEYDWEPEHQHSAKDDSFLFEPPPFFLDLFGEPAIHDFACVSPYMDAPIVGH